MKITFQEYYMDIDQTDRRERYPVTAAGESRFLYHVKNLLNAHGFDLIKRPPQKDGHLTSESYYLRTRSSRSDTPHIYVIDKHYAIRLVTEEFNRGSTTLSIVFDVFFKQPNCEDLVAALFYEPIFGEPLLKEERECQE
jgi:hypothetical protein